ncbi:MAG: hypothetical protein ACFFBP_01980 [Promethearchaeota archaeon]
MSEKVPKNNFIIEEEAFEEELTEEEEQEPAQKEIEERIKKTKELKRKRKEKRILKELSKKTIKNAIKEKVLIILKKGKVVSKESLTNLLIKTGITEYYFKINLISNQIRAEIPYIGAALKELRFDKKLNFSMINGNHVYFTKDWKKTVKSKTFKFEFDWRKHKIPEGINKLYTIFKIPGSNTSSRHILSSCYPDAKFGGFKLNIDRKYQKTNGFKILKEGVTGVFDDDKLILSCNTSSEDIDKSLYKLIQIGRRIIEELIKLNRRYSEFLKINNMSETLFIPVVPIFRELNRGSFYETKYNNALRLIYDFPLEFESKVIYGKYSILSKELKEEEFDVKNYYEFIEKTFVFQTKAFISNAILNDWIINPAKALNYVKKDEEIVKLIEEYTQDIETDRIIQERLEESLEKSELIKDMTTNLLLTLLGISFLANTPLFQWGVIIIFIAINILYIFLRTRKSKKKIF